MYAVRLWSVRHARGLNRFYEAFEKALVALHPLWNAIGYDRLERPFQAFEKASKGLLFDCQMCGQCALSSTGMSCPMNCPKNLRNGPCGGVRPNGHCEVKPEMKCVWVQGWQGAERMDDGLEKIRNVQLQVDYSLKGKSAWLRVVRMTKKIGEFAPKPVKAPGSTGAAKPASPKADAPKAERAA
ncbi:MAG TPA: methylenetetrahydrofolate reductase C-terminal domain-containing protein [Candidatus Binatia bacterium]|nr:methylenetetrahydrofolate reductase C-terminal domain-containing protein [Candidatus Binatia bacterium]